MKIHAKNGITLIEILVALFIFSVIAGSIYGALTVGNRSWLYFLDNVAVQREAREALYFMTKELREARGVLITKEEDSIALRFRKPGIGTVEYLWAKKGDSAYKLIRENNANRRVLARNISAVNFSYPSDNAIMIDVTSQKTPVIGKVISFNLKGKVALRSKVEFPD